MAAILAVGVGACGGSGVTVAAWKSRADEICAQVQTEADQVRPVLFTPTLADTMAKSAELSRKEAGQLRDLDKPDERRSEVRDYLGSLDERVRLLDAQAITLRSADSGLAAPSFDDLARVTAQAATQAQALGLTKCRAGVDMSVGGSSTTDGSTPPGSAGASTTEEPLSPNPNDPRSFETQDGA